MFKGLSKEQAHRVLEDIETVALAVALIKQAVENLGRDVQGMMNGNKKKER